MPPCNRLHAADRVADALRVQCAVLARGAYACCWMPSAPHHRADAGLPLGVMLLGDQLVERVDRCQLRAAYCPQRSRSCVPPYAPCVMSQTLLFAGLTRRDVADHRTRDSVLAIDSARSRQPRRIDAELPDVAGDARTACPSTAAIAWTRRSSAPCRPHLVVRGMLSASPPVWGLIVGVCRRRI